MREIDASVVRRFLDYNKDSGVFTWREKAAARTVVGSRAGSISSSTGYVGIQLLGGRRQAHRLALIWMNGIPPSGDIDHINGNRADNRWSNLRDVTRLVNNQNRRKASKSNSTGLIGAYRDKEKFRATICINGRLCHIGTFDTAQQAHEAYVAQKRKSHEGCTI